MMHDDDNPIEQEPEEAGYWTEAQWERFMLENEKLMDRYEQVMRENPDRKWTDPLDLYYKVHYDLDASEEPKEEQQRLEEEETDTAASPEPGEPTDTEEAAEFERDDVHDIPAYRLAFTFATSALDYLKRFEATPYGRDALADSFALHAFRIAADIAGGHGMGYEEDVLCGNIVKNRWALSHAVEARRLLRQLIERDGPHLDSTTLREVASAKFTTTLPGAPDGEYVVIQFSTSFDNKQSATEMVVPMKEPDGTWHVSGYYIR